MDMNICLAILDRFGFEVKGDYSAKFVQKLDPILPYLYNYGFLKEPDGDQWSTRFFNGKDYRRDEWISWLDAFLEAHNR